MIKVAVGAMVDDAISLLLERCAARNVASGLLLSIGLVDIVCECRLHSRIYVSITYNQRLLEAVLMCLLVRPILLETFSTVTTSYSTVPLKKLKAPWQRYAESFFRLRW